MKILLVIGVVLAFFYISTKMIGWSDSNNEVKQNIGCWFMIILVAGMTILSLVGSCKSCVSKSNSPGYDYYDAPRK